jgi:hypothetical protein
VVVLEFCTQISQEWKFLLVLVCTWRRLFRRHRTWRDLSGRASSSVDREPGSNNFTNWNSYCSAFLRNSSDKFRPCSWWQRQIRSNRDDLSDEFEAYLQAKEPSDDHDNLLQDYAKIKHFQTNGEFRSTFISSRAFQFPPSLLAAEEQIVEDNQLEFGAWRAAVRNGLETEEGSMTLRIW